MKRRKIDCIVLDHPDNVMFTGYPLRNRQDVGQAFAGSGLIVDPSCRVRYIDDGLLATCRAGLDNGEMEPWLLIAWGTLRPEERATWLSYWRMIEREAQR